MFSHYKCFFRLQFIVLFFAGASKASEGSLGLTATALLQELPSNQTKIDPLGFPFLNETLSSKIEDVDSLQRLQSRQASSTNMVVVDPARPPTFIYYCGILTQICAGIAEALSNFRGTDGAYTTTLGYAPHPRNTRTNRREACSTVAPKCKSYYACDTVCRVL